MKRYALLFGLLLGLQVISCSDEKCTCPQVAITGSGDMTTVSRTLPDFRSLVLASSGTVNITPGSTQSLSITVDDNVLEYITTEVHDATLEIRTDNRVQLSNYTLTVNITMTDLESLVLSGSGSIIGQNPFTVDAAALVLSGSGNINIELDTEALSSVISGSGAINLTGSATQHAPVVSGSGTIHAFGLDSDNCAAVVSGSGIIEVTAANQLDAVISGSGNIYYKGHPAITQTITGSGSVVDAN